MGVVRNLASHLIFGGFLYSRPLDSQTENIGQWIASDAATGSDKDSQHTGSESQTEKSGCFNDSD